MDGILKDRAFRAGLKGSLAILLVVFAVYTLIRAWVVAQALFIAIVLATALWPWVTAITSKPLGPRNWHAPRSLVTGVIYLSTFIVGAAVIWFALAALLPVFDRLLSQYPAQTAGIRTYLEPFRSGDLASGAGMIAGEIAEQAAGQQSEGGQGGTQNGPLPVSVGAFALSLFGGLTTLALVLVFTFFLLIDGDKLALWALLLVPKEERMHIRALGFNIRDRISRWVLAYAIYAVFSGLVVGAAMWALQLPDPWLYGLGGLILAIFPGIGPAAIAIPAFFVAAGISAAHALGVAIFGIALNVLDSTVITTRIYGETMRLPMFIVLLSFLIGGVLMGVWGALIAVPVAVAIQAVLRERVGLEKIE